MSQFRSGVLVLGFQKADGGAVGSIYADKSFQNDIEVKARVQKLADSFEITKVLPPGIVRDPLFEMRGAYLNRDGGWVNASKAMGAILENVKGTGGVVRPNSK